MITSVTFLYKWLTTDAEILGYILAVLHCLISITLILCIIFSHTIYPTLGFKLATYICMLLVWLQHIFLNVCIFTVAEISLIKIDTPSNLYLSHVFSVILGTSLTEAMTRLIMGETIAVSCFTLEMLSILMNYIYDLGGTWH